MCRYKPNKMVKTELDFCRANHLVAVKDGNWLDTWNSGSELMTSFWRKEEVNVK